MSAVLHAPRPKLRPMEERDVAMVAAIERAAYPFPWNATIFRDCLRVGYNCWLAEVEGTVAGYGVLSVAAAEAHILNLCVAPEWQGRGIGRTLLTRVIQLARYHRVKGIFLEVRPSNTAARRLYEKAGFVEVGCRPSYYPGTAHREDALIMSLELGPMPGDDVEAV